MSTMILVNLTPEDINWRASSQIGIPRSVLGSTIADAICNFYKAYPGNYILYSAPPEIKSHGAGVWAWQINAEAGTVQPLWVSRAATGDVPESWDRLMETLGMPWGTPDVKQDV